MVEVNNNANLDSAPFDGALSQDSPHRWNERH